MSGRQQLHGEQDQEASPGRRRPAGTGADRDSSGGIPVTRSADPRLANAGAAAPGLLSLQRTAGNAAVASLVAGAPAVQRAVQIDEITTRVDPGDAAAPAGQAAGQAAAGPAGSGPVTSDGATTTITGGQVTIDAPMTQANGVLRATTVIADSIVASSYTPGAGNVW